MKYLCYGYYVYIYYIWVVYEHHLGNAILDIQPEVHEEQRKREGERRRCEGERRRCEGERRRCEGERRSNEGEEVKNLRGRTCSHTCGLWHAELHPFPSFPTYRHCILYALYTLYLKALARRCCSSRPPALLPSCPPDTYLHIPTHTYTYLHIPTHTYTYIYLHIPTHTYTYLHIPTYTCTYYVVTDLERKIPLSTLLIPNNAGRQILPQQCHPFSFGQLSPCMCTNQYCITRAQEVFTLETKIR